MIPETYPHYRLPAPVRRKFTDATKALGKKREARVADSALKYIRKLYAIEKKYPRPLSFPSNLFLILVVLYGKIAANI
ncbi:MAG: hypothetical protein Kow0089_01370 [Desulfobulbaceae bacterium]